MNLTHKADIKPPGFERWFDLPRPFPSEKSSQRILFGHWAALDGETGSSGFVGLDTGCVWGRTLTAMRLDDGARFTIESHQPLSLEGG
jgi:bis(5'-nucleosyl)-tetraphosphatase (symmetrical)